MRVVSLLPSATELIVIAGGGPDMVGRSHECDWPESVVHALPMLTASKIDSGAASQQIDEEVRRVLQEGNGLYTVDSVKLAELKPDVIVTQSLCEVRNAFLEVLYKPDEESEPSLRLTPIMHPSLRTQVCSVSMSAVECIAAKLTPRPLIVDTNPQSYDEVMQDLLRVGEAIGRGADARAAYDSLLERTSAVEDKVRAWRASREGQGLSTTVNVAMLEWVEPLFAAGHWTPEMVTMAGGQHPLNPSEGRGKGGGKSIARPAEDLFKVATDVLIIACCGYDLPRTRKEIEIMKDKSWLERLQHQGVPVVLVDGNQMFNRPGPRLTDALEFLHCKSSSDRTYNSAAVFHVQTLTLTQIRLRPHTQAW